MEFPIIRMRRLRRTPTLRRMVRETTLSLDDLICPLFVCPGKGVTQPIDSMPGVARMSVDVIVKECSELYALGIPAVILFGIPEKKDAIGTDGIIKTGVVQQAIRAIKKAVPDMVVVTDVCLCEYTTHGHCGIIKNKDVDNDETLEQLAMMALSHAEAGADIVAPSDMMDGRVITIREALDSEGHDNIPIMSYAAKYASGFYGPFRDAAGSTPEFGDRSSYQMDPANMREAMREVALDEAEGADIVMVKPALAYLDIIRVIRDQTELPLAAYNVSGEYSMIMNAAKAGLIDGDRVMMETLLAIKRAGADMILTYFARRVAELRKEGKIG